MPSDPLRHGALRVRCGEVRANVDRALLARWQGVAATCAALVSRPAPGGGAPSAAAAATVAAKGCGGAALEWALALSVDRARCAVRCPWPFPADTAHRRAYAGEGELRLDVEALRFVGNTRWLNGELGCFDVRSIALSRRARTHGDDCAGGALFPASGAAGGVAEAADAEGLGAEEKRRRDEERKEEEKQATEMRNGPSLASIRSARVSICTGACAARAVPGTAANASHQRVFEAPSAGDVAASVSTPGHRELLAPCAVVVCATAPTLRVDVDHASLRSVFFSLPLHVMRILLTI